MIHFAKLERSPRLQRALKALKDYPGGLTTRGWIRKAHICAVSAVASELRALGYPVVCTPEGKLWRSRLEGRHDR